MLKWLVAVPLVFGTGLGLGLAFLNRDHTRLEIENAELRVLLLDRQLVYDRLTQRRFTELVKYPDQRQESTFRGPIPL